MRHEHDPRDGAGEAARLVRLVAERRGLRAASEVLGSSAQGAAGRGPS